jgi:hypothetical protein
MAGRFDGKGSWDSSRPMLIAVAVGMCLFVVAVVSAYGW